MGTVNGPKEKNSFSWRLFFICTALAAGALLSIFGLVTTYANMIIWGPVILWGGPIGVIVTFAIAWMINTNRLREEVATPTLALSGVLTLLLLVMLFSIAFRL